MRTSDKQIAEFTKTYLASMKRKKAPAPHIEAVADFALELLTNGIFGARSEAQIGVYCAEYASTTGKASKTSAHAYTVKAAEAAAKHAESKAAKLIEGANKKLASARASEKASKTTSKTTGKASKTTSTKSASKASKAKASKASKNTSETESK